MNAEKFVTGLIKQSATPPAPAMPEFDPLSASQPVNAPDTSYAGDAVVPKPTDTSYAAANYGRPVGRTPQVPLGERTWQQFGQGIGKHIYDNPMPYALGAGVAGLGLYGLHNMMQRPRRRRRYEEA